MLWLSFNHSFFASRISAIVILIDAIVTTLRFPLFVGVFSPIAGAIEMSACISLVADVVSPSRNLLFAGCVTGCVISFDVIALILTDDCVLVGIRDSGGVGLFWVCGATTGDVDVTLLSMELPTFF